LKKTINPKAGHSETEYKNFKREKYDLFYLAKLLPFRYINRAASASSHYMALKTKIYYISIFEITFVVGEGSHITQLLYPY
jgi:hypothetical protein